MDAKVCIDSRPRSFMVQFALVDEPDEVGDM